MIKLPEGIGFVAEDFYENGEMAGVISMEGRIHAERIANAKLHILFEAWVKRSILDAAQQYLDKRADARGKK